MSLVLTLFPRQARRDAVLAALGLKDDGAATFEIGRPATGATCVLVDDANAFRLIVPLMRTPTSAQDLIPPAAAAVPLGLHAPLPVEALLALWHERHVDACRQLMALCVAQGSPPPPFLPRADLVRLHGWLVALDERLRLGDNVAAPILGVDFQDGSPVTLVVALPPTGSLPPVPAVVHNVDGETCLFLLDDDDPRDDAALLRTRLVDRGSRSLARARIISPVEIVDAESLSA